jgi:hypothetical protein
VAHIGPTAPPLLTIRPLNVKITAHKTIWEEYMAKMKEPRKEKKEKLSLKEKQKKQKEKKEKKAANTH